MSDLIFSRKTPQVQRVEKYEKNKLGLKDSLNEISRNTVNSFNFVQKGKKIFLLKRI